MTYPPQGLCPFARPPPPPRPALAALADESSASLRLPLITAAIPANSTLTQSWVISSFYCIGAQNALLCSAGLLQPKGR